MEPRVIQASALDSGVKDIIHEALMRDGFGYGHLTDFWTNIVEPHSGSCAAQLAVWLNFTFQLGDGGSSPLPQELSTMAVNVCPPMSRIDNERLTALLRESKRRRRVLLEIAREHARVIVDLSPGNERQRAIDDCRLAFVFGCLADHQMRGLGALVPSRISSASIYLIFSILRKLDSRFSEYATTLALALPQFSNQSAAGYQTWTAYEEQLRLRSEIYSPSDAPGVVNDVHEAIRRHKDASDAVPAAEPDLLDGRDGVVQSSPRRDALMDAFHGVIMLAGMCFEHGKKTISRHTPIPPDKKLLEFLRKNDKEQLKRWESLLNAAWHAR
jgi:hypothetical protein